MRYNSKTILIFCDHNFSLNIFIVVGWHVNIFILCKKKSDQSKHLVHLLSTHLTFVSITTDIS